MSTAVTDDEALASIAANVTRFRGSRSQNSLAREVGTYAANIARIEQAEAMPGAGLLSRIAAALGVTVNDLLEPPRKKVRKTG